MTLKHQFNVHVDISQPTAPQAVVRVAYSYPHAGTHSIPERYLNCVLSEASPLYRAALAAIYRSVGARIPDAAMVRLPHAEIRPTATPTVLTLALIDQSRASSLPRARLYYLEAIPELQSQVERQIVVEKHEWTCPELKDIAVIRRVSRGLVWGHYSAAVDTHLFPGRDDT